MCIAINYIENSLILVFTIFGCIPISEFASLVDIPIGIASSAVALKVCTITTEIKKCKSVFKKKNNNKIVFLAKTKLKY